MPNMVLVGGMNCDLRNPLPEVRCVYVSQRESDKVREMLVHLLYYIYVSACAGPSALGVRS